MFEKDLVRDVSDAYRRLMMDYGEVTASRIIQVIFKGEATYRVFSRLCRRDELTVTQLMKMTNMPQSTIYRAIWTLRKNGIIEGKRIPRPYGVQGGRMETVWRLK